MESASTARRSFASLALAACLLWFQLSALPALAQDAIKSQESPQHAEQSTAAEQAAPPLPDFGGPLWCRSYLTGDWRGIRPCLAQQGIAFDGDVTQFYQGVARGGLNTTFNYSGHADYVLNFDFDKLGLQKGLFLKLRAEHSFGDPLGVDAGTVLPPAISPLFPVPFEHELALTDVLFTQFLSKSFAVFLGKLDTLDGDANAFAHGRGKDQFFNSSLAFSPIAARNVPYSTLGAGFVILKDLQPIFNFSVINPVDTSTTSGFDTLFEQGVTLAAELRLPVEPFGLAGHQLFGGSWSSRTFTSLNQDPRVLLPPPFSVPIAEETGSWELHYNFDQYLSVDPCNPKHGWGIFGRLGLSDGNPNPLRWFASAGLGGNSPIGGRENDTWGVGYYHGGASNELPGLLLEDANGVELFYNIEVTPWCHITPDLQVIDGAVKAADTAVVAGVRARITF
jgi:porin